MTTLYTGEGGFQGAGLMRRHEDLGGVAFAYLAYASSEPLFGTSYRSGGIRTNRFRDGLILLKSWEELGRPSILFQPPLPTH
jgi:hypothetical protein